MALSKYKNFIAGDILPAENVNSIDPDNLENDITNEAYNLIRSDINGLISFRLLNWFGDGSDGDVVISVNTDLSADMYYNNLTINNGITLNTKGYKVYVKGILLNNGTIDNSGQSAVKYTGGLGASAGTLLGGGNGGNSQYTNDNNYSGGGGGGAGVIYIRANTIINNGSILAIGGNGANYRFTSSGGLNLDGQNGQNVLNSFVNAYGGKGGAASSPPTGGQITNLKTLYQKELFSVLPFIDIYSPSNVGGGGGGAGGDSRNSSPYWWGGGGGGGGTICLVYGYLEDNGTIDVSGGTAGTSQGGGNYQATDGQDGVIFSIQL